MPTEYGTWDFHHPARLLKDWDALDKGIGPQLDTHETFGSCLFGASQAANIDNFVGSQASITTTTTFSPTTPTAATGATGKADIIQYIGRFFGASQAANIDNIVGVATSETMTTTTTTTDVTS